MKILLKNMFYGRLKNIWVSVIPQTVFGELNKRNGIDAFV